MGKNTARAKTTTFLILFMVPTVFYFGYLSGIACSPTQRDVHDVDTFMLILKKEIRKEFDGTIVYGTRINSTWRGPAVSIDVQTPHSGINKKFLIRPEITDKLWVDPENGDIYDYDQKVENLRPLAQKIVQDLFPAAKPQNVK